ncbi:hypothetical protein K431DRAFT_280823 [Polychaeton citri CBS 116435]|uniref:Uncharacterized protein n=1 Tax=Polychaeton citri CBS 116435 TaxID=1314669 RepID=A0A9P4QDW3_9PEZI|nr:hypothetical protein K431DRAFT_280823 [Polychaeton citri CBS 116435]
MVSTTRGESSTKGTGTRTSSATSSKHTTTTKSASHTATASTHTTPTSNGLKSQVTSILSDIVSDKNSVVPSSTRTSMPLSTSSPAAAVTNSSNASIASSSSARSSSSMPPGTVAGIVIGTIATVSVLALVILLWIRMRRSRQNYQGMDSAALERKLSSSGEKNAQLMRYSQEMSSSNSNTSRPRSWSGGASRRFSHLPVLETTVAPVAPSPSRQSTWSVVKSPSHELLVSSTTSLQSQLSPGTRALHSEKPSSPAERSLVSPMSSRIGDSASLSVDLVSPGGRRTVSPVQDGPDDDIEARLPRRSMVKTGNERSMANPFADGATGGNAKLKRTSQVAKLRVIETRPEVEDDTPMVSPMEEFYDSRQSVGPRTPSPAVDGSHASS